MKTRQFLIGVAMAAVVALPLSAEAQAHLPDLKRQLTPHKDRLPRPSHKLYTIHPRRLAFEQKGGKRQLRVLSHSQHHTFRKDVRGVTHHLTTPHKP